MPANYHKCVARRADSVEVLEAIRYESRNSRLYGKQTIPQTIGLMTKQGTGAH
jgi:hypothetical protein